MLSLLSWGCVRFASPHYCSIPRLWLVLLAHQTSEWDVLLWGVQIFLLAPNNLAALNPHISGFDSSSLLLQRFAAMIWLLDLSTLSPDPKFYLSLNQYLWTNEIAPRPGVHVIHANPGTWVQFLALYNLTALLSLALEIPSTAGSEKNCATCPGFELFSMVDREEVPGSSEQWLVPPPNQKIFYLLFLCVCSSGIFRLCSLPRCWLQKSLSIF